jgi:hypothetical protein
MAVSFGDCASIFVWNTYHRRERSNAKNKIQLYNGKRLIFQERWIGKITIVGFEDRRAMHHWVQRSPFLEIYVD